VQPPEGGEQKANCKIAQFRNLPNSFKTQRITIF
jgi:hypothetical protein